MFSPSWYRVARLRPRLRGHTELHRHVYRGQTWYVLQNHSSGQFHRFSPAAYWLIGLLDGQRSMDDVWHRALEHFGDDAPTQDELLRLLAQLHRADALVTDIAPDIAELQRRDERLRTSRWTQRLRSPLAVRIPLFDPEPLLQRMIPWLRPVFGRLGLVLWLAMVGTAAVAAGIHWDALSENLTDRVLSLENALLLWITFPLVKTLHEFGHALAAKAWGGEVHEMGVMFLVLTPIPYVDVTSANAFPDRWKRVVVGAAGMMVELAVASLALLLWLHAEPGAIRATAYNVMLIAGVSTLLFNANPLVRFDGYYILADFLEVPNLATRASGYLKHLGQRHLFGLRDKPAPITVQGEPAILVIYGVVSFLYRGFLIAVIALFVASRLFFLGVLLAVWGVAQMILLPLVRLIAYVLFGSELRRVRMRAILTSSLLVAGGAVLVFALPVPQRTVVEGVVSAPEESALRARADGFVVELLRSGEVAVAAGEAILVTRNVDLRAEDRGLRAQVAELEARLSAEHGDRVRAKLIREELAQAEARRARASERIDALVVRSPVAGVLLLRQPEDLLGRFVRRGELLGHVVDFDHVTIRGVVHQADVDRVRQQTRRVDFRLANALHEVQPAKILREVPAATDTLPSPALSLEGGGRISLDPEERDGYRSFQKFFQFDLQPEVSLALRRIGGRAYVRFHHDWEPLGWQWGRRLRQLFLREFHV